jgi:hypothetical protein
MLAIAVTAVPLPVLAADRVASLPAQPLKTSIAQHAAREVLAAASKSQARSARQSAPQRGTQQSGGFFRSPAGIACVAVLAAGTGYALYSASHDRIHSVARESQK